MKLEGLTFTKVTSNNAKNTFSQFLSARIIRNVFTHDHLKTESIHHNNWKTNFFTSDTDKRHKKQDEASNLKLKDAPLLS